MTAADDGVTDVWPKRGRPATVAPAAAPRSAEPLSVPLAPGVRPTARFMFRHPAHPLAFGFGAGLAPIAPGTVGTLWAWLVWALLLAGLAPATQGMVIGIGLLLGCWAAARTARHLGSADPGAIVVDEVIAFWLVLWLVTPAGFWAQLVAFALFRYFDAAKPGPVGWADRLLHGARGWRGGVGVMLDDLVAAFCTLLVMALWRAL